MTTKRQFQGVSGSEERRSKMKDKPLVSIVTPSYNQGEFIEDTILSVKNQDYPNIEHLVVDGGSTDNTLEILRKYENQYNLRWISEPDEGQSDAVNKGFRIARGDIVGWLNSDDVYFTRDIISYVVYKFEEVKDVDVMYGDRAVINENSFIKRVCRMPSWNYNRLLRGSCIPQPSTFFRKNVILENKLDKNSHFSMDLEFWLRLGEKCNFSHMDRIIAGDRLHAKTKRMSNTTIHKDETKKY
jgi:glycosyltransferase involved in cell wall biosynthesis